ncbi:MAG: hypothetical protein RLZZ476_1779 [Verrucomicrobiota bacterium]|jgi:hypothetical protein
MGNFFPRWTNWLPLKVAISVVFIALGVSIGVAYYFTPKYTRVGYEPTQPVPFSHKLHAGQLGMDCRICHSFGEMSSHSNVPTNQTCFNCHGQGKGGIRATSEKLTLVQKANETGKSIPWVKVHKAPDYVYFNHSAHLNRGISCVACHGKINEMEVVRHDQPQSMGWCLDCHREPEKNLRPLDFVTKLDYTPGTDVKRADFYKGLLDKKVPAKDIAEVIGGEGAKADTLDQIVALAEGTYGAEVTQKEVGTQLKKHWQIQPPENCTACHR